MKKVYKVMTAACIAGICAFALGCGGQQKATENKQVTQKIIDRPSVVEFAPLGEIKEGRKNVYAVLKIMKGNYWGVVIDGIKDGAKVADVNVYLGGVLRDGGWEHQNELLKTALDKKADAIILATTDGSKLVDMSREIMKKNIPLVTVDSPLNSKEFTASFNTNNLKAGEECAKAMLDELKASGVKDSDNISVAISAANLMNATQLDRAEAVIATWAKLAPKQWKLIEQPFISGGDMQKAEENAVKALQIKDLKGIICVNNSSTDKSALFVMKANRKDVVVSGFDYGSNTKEMIKNSAYHCSTIVQNQYKMGFEGVKAAASNIGKDVKQSLTVDTGITIVNAKSQAEYEASLKK
ncbi:MAG: substrate-binding domain-containing protein [Phascolarctobacterium sp.]|nr:substrate-binding domain-containing protein [Phascolarctobacterium sp.]